MFLCCQAVQIGVSRGAGNETIYVAEQAAALQTSTATAATLSKSVPVC